MLPWDEMRRVLAQAIRLQLSRYVPGMDGVERGGLGIATSTETSVCVGTDITRARAVPRGVRRPRPLTREGVTNLAQDKQERALVNNVILPQGIAVSYSCLLYTSPSPRD